MSSMQQPAEVVENAKKYSMEIENAKTELTKRISISKDKSLAPSMLRLAYAYQFTLAAKSHDHAANEDPSETKKENNKPAANKDFQEAIALCGEIKNKYSKITYADIYQLAGVVAVKALEGPEIEFVPGREDTSITPDEGCLPDDQLGASDLRNKFYPMELGNQDIVALYGGLKLARAHSKGSGGGGSMTEEPLKFDNKFFKDLLGSSRLKDLPPTERALVQDSIFRKFVEFYEEKKEAFFKDYAEAHKTLSEYKPASSFYESAWRKNTTLTQKAVGVAIAATVAILGFFYLIKRGGLVSLPHSSSTNLQFQ